MKGLTANLTQYLLTIFLFLKFLLFLVYKNTSLITNVIQRSVQKQIKSTEVKV